MKLGRYRYFRYPPGRGALEKQVLNILVGHGDARAQVGFVRGENESLAETLARSLGITRRELGRRLQRRAAGRPAELATDIG